MTDAQARLKAWSNYETAEPIPLSRGKRETDRWVRMLKHSFFAGWEARTPDAQPSSTDEVERRFCKALDDEISALTDTYERMQETTANSEAQELYVKIEALSDFRSSIAAMVTKP